jgi:hypothetical protein
VEEKKEEVEDDDATQFNSESDADESQLRGRRSQTPQWIVEEIEKRFVLYGEALLEATMLLIARSHPGDRANVFAENNLLVDMGFNRAVRDCALWELDGRAVPYSMLRPMQCCALLADQ